MIVLLLSLLVSSHAASPSFFSDLDNFKNKSLSLETEKQNLEASSDYLLSKKLFWTPKLSLSGNKVKTKVTSSDVVGSDYLSADLTWNIFRGGSDWNSMEDASAQKKAQELQVLNETLRVETKASDLIFKSLYLAESYRIQEQLLKLKEESLKIVSDRFHQGKLPSQEVT